MTRVLTVSEMTLRAGARRRTSLALLVVLPLAFYLVRHDQPGQAVRFLGIGLAWATSTFALFAAIAARPSEPRLQIAGWSWRQLLGGRVVALATTAFALAAAYLALLALDSPVDDKLGLAILLIVTASTGVALGTGLGALVSQGLEGALLLFIVAGVQFIADPPTLLAHLLPFWSTRELATFAVDGADAGSLAHGVGHALVTIALCALVTIVVSARRPLR